MKTKISGNKNTFYQGHYKPSTNGRYWPKAAIDLIHSYPRDIGSHIENMVSYVTGLEIDSLCARLDKILN